MEDLIKRQEAIEVIHKFFREKVDYDCGERKEVTFDEIEHILECNKELSSAIKEIPTAFDVEAVVNVVREAGAKLCCNKSCNNNCDCCVVDDALRDIIDAVKKGGVKND